MSDTDPAVTPKRGLTAVIRDEIGVKTHVQLGFVIMVFGSLLGGILWLTSIKADAATALQRIEEIRVQRKEDKDDTRRQLDKMDKKIDEILTEMRKGKP